MTIVPHNRLYFDKAEEKAVLKTLRSGYWVCGRKTEELEKYLCQMSGYKYAVCVSSGLSALRLALLALGINRKSKVIIPAYSCVALANAVMACGAEPLPVDVEGGLWTLDCSIAYNVAKKENVDAIIAVDMFGIRADVKKLKKIKVPIIEDFAHFFWKQPAKTDERADIAITSFYATKLIGAGEGGAILTDKKEYANFVRDWRDYTNKQPNPQRLNDKMTDIEAALAIEQLKKIKVNIAKREKLAKAYLSAFSENEKVMAKIRLPLIQKDRIWYRFVILLNNCLVDDAIQFFKRHHIAVASPVVDWRQRSLEISTPNADAAYKFLLSLPMYPALKQHEQQKVIQTLIKFCK